MHATLVEMSDHALEALRTNIAALGLEAQTQVVAADVARAVRRLARIGPFDLVLADPPWALVDSGEAPRALVELVADGALAERASLVLEHAARGAAPDLAGLLLEGTRRYGDTALAIYKPAILGPPRPEHASTTPG
jgi:16S rRNA G966 N2-methylase RsmD